MLDCVDLGAGVGVARVCRGEREQRALGAIRAERVLAGEPALFEAGLVVGAAGDGVIALAHVEGALEHAQAPDQLGDQEAGVCIAATVIVAALVDRHTIDGQLDVLPFARIEAAQVDALGVTVAAFLGEIDARCELQQLGGAATRYARELAHLDPDIGNAGTWRRVPPDHRDLGRRGGGRLRRRMRGRRWSRLRRLSRLGLLRCLNRRSPCRTRGRSRRRSRRCLGRSRRATCLTSTGLGVRCPVGRCR